MAEDQIHPKTEGGGCSNGGFEEKEEIFSPAHMLSDFYGCESKENVVCDAPVGEGDVDQRGLGGGGGERPGVLAGRLHISNGQ